MEKFHHLSFGGWWYWFCSDDSFRCHVFGKIKKKCYHNNMIFPCKDSIIKNAGSLILFPVPFRLQFRFLLFHFFFFLLQIRWISEMWLAPFFALPRICWKNELAKAKSKNWRKINQPFHKILWTFTFTMCQQEKPS